MTWFLQRFAKASAFVCLPVVIPECVPAGLGVTVDQVVYGKTEHLVFEAPRGIFFDAAKGEIYVTDSGSSSVLIFDSQGTFLHGFRHTVNDGGREVPGEPRDVVVDSRGMIFLTDILSRQVEVLSPRGITIDAIDPSAFEPFRGRNVYPQHLAIDSDDTLFITLEGDVREIIVLDPERRLVRRIRGVGDGFGRLTGVALDEGGNVMVTDVEGSHCVQIYSRSGTFLRGFGAHEVGDENFSHPHGLASTSDGDIWVVDTFRQVVKRFSADGSFKEMVGGFGVMPGDLLFPVGIAADNDETLYVVEKAGRRFQILHAE